MKFSTPSEVFNQTAADSILSHGAAALSPQTSAPCGFGTAQKLEITPYRVSLFLGILFPTAADPGFTDRVIKTESGFVRPDKIALPPRKTTAPDIEIKEIGGK